jgi:hypothetical protein
VTPPSQLISLAFPEPEVVQSALARANHKSLARIIAALVNENEPLLKAEQDGTTVTVRERGGPAVMLVSITEKLR